MLSNSFTQKSERHSLVHRLNAEGKSAKEISEIVGVKRVTIWKYLKTLEPAVPPRRQKSLEQCAVARQMKADGKTYAEIGEHFGFSPQSAASLIKAAPETDRFGVCSVCGNEANLCFHHTDYIKNEYLAVCRACHMKLFHPQATKSATKASANKRRRPPKPKIGRMGPAPRTLNGKTAKELAAIWGVGLHQAQLRMAKELGPRWVRRDKKGV